MRWEQGRQSSNVEDRRATGGRMVRGGAIGGGALLLVVIVSLLTGQDPGAIIGAIQGGAPATRSAGEELPDPGATPANDPGLRFVSAILADTEDTWQQLFAAAGARYEPPTLVLFREAVDSACGHASAAVGPFYCARDRKVYLDLGFFLELERRLGAGGDFARAYVIAHEVGHHVQRLLGLSAKVDEARSRARDEAESNALSVRQELQADCFAGVWARHADRQRQMLEKGDVEEGLTAAGAIGDDRLQREAGRRVRPDSFTHGSSAQRVAWFRRGLESGAIEACDTFNADQP